MKTRYLKTRHLRRMADRYGMVGLLFASAALGVWYLWNRQRGLTVVLTAFLGASFVMPFFATECRGHGRIAANGGHVLYLGRRAPIQEVQEQPEQRILRFWPEDFRTQKVRTLARDFDAAVAGLDQERAVQAGDRLSSLLPPPDAKAWDTDGNWRFRATLGEVYLEQSWCATAEREFRSVLSGIPPAQGGWGKSGSRQTATYGLARICALRGAYAEALALLARAPDEYRSGCGNCMEGEEAYNYPRKIVWTIASKPYSVAVSELKDVMRGRFDPLTSSLNGDTSDEQRQHAALEAALTLGCLYDATKHPIDAKACWTLTATKGDPAYEATWLARSQFRDLMNGKQAANLITNHANGSN